jgi:RNA polymerase sigma factor (TIGR02999 family)
VEPETEPLVPLLRRVREGSPEAAEALFTEVYAELRRRAGRALRSQRRDHTLTPTALVHEVWLKMARPDAGVGAQDRAHFLAIASRAMRQVLLNHARDRGARKRGGDAPRKRVTLAGAWRSDGGAATDLLALHEALAQLEALDQRQARIAQWRLLAGLSVAETASLLGVSTRTVELDWRMAKDFLAARLGSRPASRG